MVDLSHGFDSSAPANAPARYVLYKQPIQIYEQPTREAIRTFDWLISDVRSLHPPPHNFVAMP